MAFALTLPKELLKTVFATADKPSAESLLALKGKAVVILLAGRNSYSSAYEQASQIVAAADDDSVAVVVVADLLGVPGFVKGAAQESLLKCHTECNAAVSKALGNHQKPQQRVLTWLDWEGSFARELDVVGECNDVYLVTVLDPSGQVTLRVKQKVNGMTENQLQRMTLASARKALKRD